MTDTANLRDTPRAPSKRIDETRISAEAGREVRGLMVVSSACVAPADADWLDTTAFKVFEGARPGALERLIAKTPYGWVVCIVEAGADDMPERIAGVLHDAAARGCSYVLFDRDADVIDGMTTLAATPVATASA